MSTRLGLDSEKIADLRRKAQVEYETGRILIAVTGTRRVDAVLRAAIDRKIDELFALERSGTPRVKITVIHGCCVGVDAYFAQRARDIDIRTVAVVPSDRSQIDRLAFHYSAERFEMDQGTDYRDRDTHLVAMCHRLVAFPLLPEKHPASRRSGTWLTVRIAREMGIDVEIVETMKDVDWKGTKS